jgi:hypothetical protein
MPQEPETRARQHLLLQGFTLYTCEAAVALLLLGSLTLIDPAHAWAVEFDAGSQAHTSKLSEDSDVASQLRRGALMASGGQRHVLTHTRGGLLLVPLQVGDVRTSRTRIEDAVALSRVPPTVTIPDRGPGRPD